MFTLFDILQAQGGNGVQGVGQQFGLTPEQTRKAMEALLPAFTLGLQRNALTDPTGFAQIFGMAGPSAAAPRTDLLVQQLFGSPHLSQAVIQQAAAASGVATPILKQMLPVLAGMVVAGIVHVMINQAPPQPQAPTPPPTPYGFPPAAYWTEMVDAFLAAGGTRKEPDAANRRSQGLAKTQTRQARAAPSREAEPAQVPGGAESAPFELFQQLVQSGLDAQQENAKAMQRLFDAFWTEPSAQRKADSAGSSPGSRRP